MPKASQSPSKKKSKECPICRMSFRIQNFPGHHRKCERERIEQRGEIRYAKTLERKVRKLEAGNNAAIPDELLSAPTVDDSPSFPHGFALDFAATDPMDIDVGSGTSVHEPTTNSVAQTAGLSDGPRVHKFTTEYHPNSGRVSETQLLDRDEQSSKHRPPPNMAPWRPFFNTREDFMFSELLMEVGMTKNQTDRLIKLFKRCLDGKGSFTLSSYSDVRSAWDRASSQLTPFKFDNISVPYRGVDQTFEVPHRPLWDWAVDLILDSRLAPYFEWDARKVSKHDGENITRVYDEPWTADTFWDFQSQIPEGARPLCFILYADKAKLSSFGTAKSYPVVARCANLPTEIRNGNFGVGGGRVVGWLPIVPETPADSGKPAFVNFKRKVWHCAFRCIIESIIVKSKVGCWLQSADGAQNLFFPAITILSADYEEQCVMSLIRGLGGKLPCPVCLVPKAELGDVSTTWPRRTTVHTKQLIEEAQALNRGDCETHLSNYGIRDIDNVFWLVNNSDPHCALSFDRLHSNNSGLFGYHLWEQFKVLVTQVGRDAATKVDKQFDLVPRWRGLNHFKEVIKVAFTDGAKYEDISKVVVFAAHNIFSRNDPEGWKLLLCLRSFSFLDLLISLEVHTEQTILTGRKELVKFGKLIQEYVELSTSEDEDEGKQWNFPKMHALVHSFDDIEAKGASRNYNTKPNEKIHGPLRKFYLNRTNFKNVAPQILNLEHSIFVAALIRGQVDEVDEAIRMQRSDNDEDNDEDNDGDGSSHERRKTTFSAGATTLRSCQPPVTLGSLDYLGAENPTFRNFRAKLAAWLTAMLPIYGLNFVPGCTRVEFQADDQITEYRSMKVCYESKVDWQQYLDYVYCSPCFHGQERHDFIILKTTDGFIFAQLAFIFTCTVAEQKFALCLVRPLDASIGQLRTKDRELRLHRLRAKTSLEFFFAQSIVRGAPLIQDFTKPGDYFVMDVVDHSGDLFIRCSEIFGQ